MDGGSPSKCPVQLPSPCRVKPGRVPGGKGVGVSAYLALLSLCDPGCGHNGTPRLIVTPSLSPRHPNPHFPVSQGRAQAWGAALATALLLAAALQPGGEGGGRRCHSTGAVW